MKTTYISIIACLLLGGVVLFFSGCGGEPQEAELEVSNLEYTIVQEGRHLHSVKVTGSLRNVGNVDVSDVLLTGDCPSCVGSVRAGNWFLTDHQKADAQSDVIRFLGRGERSNFEFQGLAYYSTGGGAELPDAVPADLNVYVETYTIGN